MSEETTQVRVEDGTQVAIDAIVEAELLDAQAFFSLVDEVLVEAGRAPLEPGGPQRAIIEVRPDDRVLQIVAGPGSGKTEVLVWRVLFELLVRGTDARRVMVTTFTRKAATELSVRIVERSDGLLAAAHRHGLTPPDPRVHDLRIGTIHSLCDSLLAEYDSAHMETGTQVIDDVETRVRMARDQRWLFRDGADPPLLDRLLDAEQLVALFRAPWLDDSRAPRVMGRVELLMSFLNQHTETWIPRCAAENIQNGIEAVHGLTELTEDMQLLQSKWETYLDDNRILDFATLQKRFLERQSILLSELDHVLVDEFQDTNPIQYGIHSAWLQADATRLTVVGDDDQSLYRFRGSDIACFARLQEDCGRSNVPYRQEILSENWRSTAAIVRFSQYFREHTELREVSMDKTVVPPAGVPTGVPVRLVEGPWSELCEQVATEISDLGAGRVPDDGEAPPTVGILLFSTSERQARTGARPAGELRAALTTRGLRVYNPRNKVAGRSGSPVHDLLGLISYLVDPVHKAPVGSRGRPVEVWASRRDDRTPHAVSAPPEYPVSPAHSAIQRRFIKSTGDIDAPGADIAPLLTYLDEVRERLVDATMAHQAGRGNPPRLSLGGLVARLLAMEYFRAVGFSVELFREALFTQLLEANIAPTRLTRSSLDGPMMPTRTDHEKIVWPAQYWRLLNVFGMLVEDVPLDDVEVESFAEHAVSVLTFHQAKGLEFDHVYVALTGRESDPSPVLQTKLFSGEDPDYFIETGQPVTENPETVQLATADRDREVYVALTRAKQTLTILHSPGDNRPLMELHHALADAFADVPAQTPEERSQLSVREFLA